MQPQETLWQAPATAAQPTTGAQLQWSTVGGLEAIKTAPVAGVNALDSSGTTTYYISAGDLYQTQLQSQTAQLTGNGYALLDSNENYLLEQQEPQQQTQPQQQQQQLQHQQQPIMILIQQPELQQPVASASNPQQPPLHITYGASLGNELHAAYPQQQLQPHLQQQQQQQQHQEMQSQPQRLQQQVQNTVLSTPPAAVPPPTRGRPPVLKCRFCQNGPRFSSSLEYSRHIIELHPPVAPFNCPHCPMAFAGRNKRNQHILSNHMVQQFQCGQCSQLLPSQRALDLHLQRFHMPLPTEPPADAAPAGAGVRLEEVQLQIANNNNHSEQPKQLQQQQQQQQHHQHMPCKY
ncbi:PREDICTED: nuclear transcription factor Y subunit beta [Drosophila arizonae]|uniref:Nuclear transcription factor Y subunit beta n=1 Tax=Drosophila arizonae TaxID=7263 RepID=A0ABM1Q0L5_DROAR|nr:PREDICTED: nuclear transcription factor Y subunit beta [Drosophila arizonae]